MWPKGLPFLLFAFFIVSSIENFNRSKSKETDPMPQKSEKLTINL